MQLLTFLSICLTLGSTASTAAAAAVAKRDYTQTSTSSSSYLLRTKVINGGRADFDGLYVNSYHTFAGASDATLGSKEQAVRGQLVNGTQYFDILEYPWTFELPQPITYNGMSDHCTHEPFYYVYLYSCWAELADT